MARTILVKDVVKTALVQLSDVGAVHTQVPDLLSYMSFAQLVIAKFLPASCSRMDAIKLKPGTEQSIAAIAQADIRPGDGSAAEAVSGTALVGLVRNMGADGQTPGNAILLADQEALDASDPAWHTRTGTAVRRYTFDPIIPQRFHVTPGVPSTPAVWVTAKFLANPKLLPTAADVDAIPADLTFSIDDRYVDDILAYSLARAFMVDSEVPGAAGLASSNANIFLNSINVQATAMTGVNPNLQHLPINPSAPVTAR